jgi:predicted ribosome quality control (RQC) complex YloA/Tae2 family protein
MPKTRLTSLDVHVLVTNVRAQFLGLRLANLYDLGPRTYLLKFHRPNEGGKGFLLIESGVRMHSTDFERAKNDLPNQFRFVPVSLRVRSAPAFSVSFFRPLSPFSRPFRVPLALLRMFPG